MPENKKIVIQIEVPFRIYAYRRRPLAQTKESVKEYLRIQASIALGLMTYCADLVDKGEFSEEQFALLGGILGGVGKGFMEALELADFDRHGHLQEASLPENSEAEKV